MSNPTIDTTAPQPSETVAISKQFPGPFEVQSGKDGVDRTFDVVCRSSNTVIVAARYWTRETEAWQTAQAIANALNNVKGSASEQLPCPGPFAAEWSSEPPSNADIICKTTDEFVVGIDYWTSENALQLGEWIAAALNKNQA